MRIKSLVIGGAMFRGVVAGLMNLIKGEDPQNKERMKRPRSALIIFIVGSISTLLLFQNCQSSSGGGGGGANSISSVSPSPCPPDQMGSPEMSDITISGSSVSATSVSISSGYTNDSGNQSSNPLLQLSLLNTNVEPTAVCDQSVVIQCNIALDAGATGVLWGTDTREAISGSDFQCTATSPDLAIDPPGGTPSGRPSQTTLQIQPRNQMPDTASTNHVCMQGTGTVTVKLRNPYNKESASRTFKITITNSCPKEQKTNAGAEIEAQGMLGESVSISGTTGAVLTSGLNAFGLSNVGGVQIFDYNGTTWNYTTTLIPPTAELENDVKPNTVLINGNNLFLGNAAINSQAGRVWLFQRNPSTGAWSKVFTLNGAPSSKLGSGLAFNGTHLFIGAPGIAGNGSVLVYALSGSSLTSTSTINGTINNSDFGVSIAVSGTRLVIGAPGNALNTTTTGTFYVCDISTISSPTCTPWDMSSGKIGTEIIPSNSRLGSSVALSGNFLLVGARGWYPSTLTTAPALRHGLAALVHLGNSTVKVFKGSAEEFFGTSLAFASTSFFIGAKEALNKRGRVVQMGLPTDGSVNATLRFNYYGLNQGPLDRFGSSLSISGNKLLIGAPLDEEMGFSTAGSATFMEIIKP